jgi:hypothetical protein
MKTRTSETAVRGSSARPRNGPLGADRPPAPRSSVALVEKIGPHWAGVAVALLIAVLFLQAWFTPAPPDNSSHRPRNGFNGWGCPPGRTYHWYVSNGQWKADARTAVAILQYVLSPLVQGALKH